MRTLLRLPFPPFSQCIFLASPLSFWKGLGYWKITGIFMGVQGKTTILLMRHGSSSLLRRTFIMEHSMGQTEGTIKTFTFSLTHSNVFKHEQNVESKSVTARGEREELWIEWFGLTAFFLNIWWSEYLHWAFDWNIIYNVITELDWYYSLLFLCSWLKRWLWISQIEKIYT
jgi:hypothetical protein